MPWHWIGFIAFVLVMLALDLFVVNRKAHVIRAREALVWTGVCVALALGFVGVVYVLYDRDWMSLATRYAEVAGLESTSGVASRAALEFLQGWMIEYLLSLDNIFVIALIFLHFKVEPKYQHRVLFWGILGALVMRGVMILGGAMLIERFHWIIYVFGAVLLYTAFKMLRGSSDHFDPEEGWVLRVGRKLLPVSEPRADDRFFVRGTGGRLMVTPLFLVLLVVEATDLIFAVDSIPAIFGVTRDPFLVFTSNVFAILGLRSLYFALASLMDSFSHLKYSLAFVLAFVGVKMILTYWHIEIAALASLGVIVTALAAGMVSSLLANRRKARAERAGGPPGVDDGGRTDPQAPAGS